MMSSLRARACAACLVGSGVLALATVVAFSGHAGAATQDAGQHFAVLNTEAAPGDAALFSDVAWLAGPEAAVSPDPAAARSRFDAVVGAGDQRREVSVTVGTDSDVCLGYREPGPSQPIFVFCAPIEAAATEALVGISHEAPGADVDPRIADVTALVPDGVSTVTFVLADGVLQHASVTLNTVAARLLAPAAMTFTGDAGTKTIYLDVDGG